MGAVRIVDVVGDEGDAADRRRGFPRRTRGLRRLHVHDLLLVKVSFDKGGVGTLHQHPHSQITHVESGVFEVEIGEEKKILKGGDAFYIPPNMLHGAVCLEAGILIDVFSPMREDFIDNK